MGILRTRMERDLVVRGRSEHTRRAYLRAVADLTRYHHRSPDQLTDGDVQQYVRHLIEERQFAWASCRQTVYALRFFYEVTLGRGRSDFSIPLPKGGQKLPQILSREEVALLLDGVENLKLRAVTAACQPSQPCLPPPSPSFAPCAEVDRCASSNCLPRFEAFHHDAVLRPPSFSSDDRHPRRRDLRVNGPVRHRSDRI